jgi:hypothetical protein
VYYGEQEASVNGGGSANVTYEMDGADHNDIYVNMNLPFPNPDALQEFNLQSNNMSAEYGNSSAVVNIVTKSGTNQFHGDLFEFVRNGDLNARSFFAPTQDTLKRNQFGGTFGGPIKKDKLFFFATYQGTRIRQAATGATAIVPTAAERAGNFSAIATPLKNPVTGVPFPGNIIPTLSAPAQFLLQSIPEPQQANGTVTYTGPTLVEDDDQVMGKVDYIRGKNQITGRYFYGDFREPPDLGLAKSNLLAMDPNANVERATTLAVNDTYSASATVLFSTWFGYDKQTGGTLSGAPFGFQAAGINISPPALGAPAMEAINVSTFDIASGHEGVFNRNDWRIREEATVQHGAHEFEFGGEFFHMGTPEQNTNNQSGSFTFTGALSGNDFADFIFGQATSFTQAGGVYYNYGGSEFNLFAQDNWRVSKKLTVNLGVRWDPYMPYTDTQGRIHCYLPGLKSIRYPNMPAGLLFAGDPGCPKGGTYSDLANIAPRLGFALNLGHNTVFRGGAGIYYTMPQTSQANGLTNGPPFAASFTPTDVNFQNPWASAGLTNPFPAAFASSGLPPPTATFPATSVISHIFPLDFHSPTLGTWAFTLQHQFGKDWLASIGYMGNGGYFLSSNQKGVDQPLNWAVYIPGTNSSGAPLSTVGNEQSRRINPIFGTISDYDSSYNSNYHSLQINFERRLSHGVSVIANYTWSKAMDDYPNGSTTWTDPYNRDAYEWGPSADNVPNVFHLTEVWQIPHPNVQGIAAGFLNGWEVNSTTAWQNGFPITVLSGVDNSLTGVGLDRANFTGSNIQQAVLGDQPHGQTVSHFFNTALFTANAIGTFGNEGKGILTGPGFFRTDVGVIKNTKVTEGMSVQFRAEFFNVFNNVNFFNPNATASSAGFGKITALAGTFGGVDTGIGDARILQFALKLMF